MKVVEIEATNETVEAISCMKRLEIKQNFLDHLETVVNCCPFTFKQNWEYDTC